MAEEKQQETTKNTVDIEQAGPCKKRIKVEVPAETVKAATDRHYTELRRDAVVPGFRRGRAPRRLLEKRFGKDASEQIKLKMLADASSEVIKDSKLDIIGEPDIDFEKIELPEQGPLKFDFEVEVRPEFDLPPLEKIELEKSDLEVTDEQIDKEIDRMRSTSGTWQVRDGAAREGDQVIADAVVKIDQAEEKLEDIEILVSHNGFVGEVPVENLDKILAGAKTGQAKTAGVEVPKTYFNEKYRGKKADIQITVKEVKSLKPADMDQAFFTRWRADGERDLRDRIGEALQQRLQQQARACMAEQVYKYLLEKTKFDLPLDLVAQQANMLLRRQYANLLMRGYPQEQIQQRMDQLRAGSEKEAEQQLKVYFLMEKVAEKLEIDVSEEEVNGHIAQLAIHRGQRPERLREQLARDGSLEQINVQLREDKCIAKLMESAKIAEAKPKAKKPKAARTVKKAKQ
jgi:trigger factor